MIRKVFPIMFVFMMALSLAAAAAQPSGETDTKELSGMSIVRFFL